MASKNELQKPATPEPPSIGDEKNPRRKKDKEREKPLTYLAFDAERTGDKTNDYAFSIGLAYAKYHDDAQKIVVAKKRFTLSLGKPSDKSWEEWWNRKGFDKICWNEFWSKPAQIDVLNLLHTENKGDFLSDSRALVAKEMNDFLTEMDRINPRVKLVTDTVGMDTEAVNAFLVAQGYPGIQFSRAGRWLGGTKVDSYIMGLFYLTPNSDPEEMDALQKKFIDPLRRKKSCQSHLPDEDAEDIVVLMDAATQYANRKRKTMES